MCNAAELCHWQPLNEHRALTLNFLKSPLPLRGQSLDTDGDKSEWLVKYLHAGSNGICLIACNNVLTSLRKYMQSDVVPVRETAAARDKSACCFDVTKRIF